MNLPWTWDWIPKHLQLGNNRIVRETILNNWCGEISSGIEGDDLVSTFEVGDTFAINAKFGNVEGADFYVICYSKILH